MIFPKKLSVLAQVAHEMIYIDKTILLNPSAETTVYISSKLMVNLGNTFRNVLRGVRGLLNIWAHKRNNRRGGG